MENRKILFKSQSRVLSPHNHIKINRERQRVTRALNREKHFQSNRNIGISPSTVKTVTAPKPNCSSLTDTNDNRENQPPGPENESSISKMPRGQEDYLQRFMKWRTASKQQVAHKQQQRNTEAPSQQTPTKKDKQKRQSVYVVVDSKPAPPTSMKKQLANIRTPFGFAAETKTFSTIPPVSATSRAIVLKPETKWMQKENKPIIENTKVTTIQKSKPSGTIELAKTAVSSVNSTSRPISLRAQPFNVPKVGNSAIGSLQGGGAVGKFKAVAVGVKNDISSQLKTRMKAKNTVPVNGRKKDCMNINKDMMKATLLLQPPSTPLDFAHNNNLFQAQATSTQCKSNNSSANLFEAYNLSPVQVGEKSCAKRQLLPSKSSNVQEKRKCNFVRCSEANELIVSPSKPEIDEMTVMPVTPQRDPEVQPNYLSPFVSVSRGKVNTRAEAEKRNSIYLQRQDQEKPEASVLVRRTQESVLYFRLQLDNEIRRLHSLCDEWHLYSNQNKTQLHETGGMDMIDVAIGQTKLLTSKKLMQFKDLIDRCEAGATGIGMRPNDGESTKVVLVEDLEGWWDLIRLQSDNLNKRFDNLIRWKANNWLDPDTVVLQSNPNVHVKNKKKATAKASSHLKDFLRKAYANKRNNEASECLKEMNLTLERRSLNRTFVVRDHKSSSPARTLLRVPRCMSKQPSNIRNLLLKSAILGAAEEISENQQMPPKNRISILKTPGSKKRETPVRNVAFSAKKNVRRFQFTFEEGHRREDDDATAGIDKLEDCEEDVSPKKRLSHSDEQEGSSRIYYLRNRKIVLRPSTEFM
ncbi:guanylate kinase-associated protein mars isoform X3 [Drosophila grimshawi]|uniref:guanylate kinase-associated protein mars isoform X3 n=1 Tax=Drosophila grimshawi TaxID=7222 RepID=UPI000C8705D3|nr:guanylate kinase-associated protein mars isoform X3 [Drosophila grimshawi]